MKSASSGRGNHHALRGTRAEAIAASFLESAGFEIIARNLRVGRLEVDIVARSGDLVVLAEVRTRGPGAWVSALSSVGPEKRDRLRRAAVALWRGRFASDPTLSRMRFDLVAVRFDERGAPKVEHVPAAFVL